MRDKIARLNDKISQQRQNHKNRSLLWRLLVFIGASICLISGIILIFLPGPGLALIALALVLYSLEFHWLGTVAARLGSNQQQSAGDQEPINSRQATKET